MSRILVLSLLLLISVPLNATPAGEAESLVREELARLVTIVSACRLPLATDPVALRGLVQRDLRPLADVLHGGQVILGRYWPDASPEQRRRFAEALYGTLASRHASSLLLLTGSNVRVVPGSEPQPDGTVAVELSVDAGLARPLPVFLHLRRAGTGWRIHDARWEGQSFLLGLRRVYAEEIGRRGLEAVITSLEETAPARAGAPEKRPTMAGRCLLDLRAR